MVEEVAIPLRALGAALNADFIDIFTDVEGIMTADPRIAENARPLSVVTYSEVCNMAYQGAKVIHPRAVEIAMQAKVPMRVRSTYADSTGTLVTSQGEAQQRGSDVQERLVTGIAHVSNVTQIKVFSKEGHYDTQAEVFKAMAQEIPQAPRRLLRRLCVGTSPTDPRRRRRGGVRRARRGNGQHPNRVASCRRRPVQFPLRAALQHRVPTLDPSDIGGLVMGHRAAAPARCRSRVEHSGARLRRQFHERSRPRGFAELATAAEELWKSTSAASPLVAITATSSVALRQGRTDAAIARLRARDRVGGRRARPLCARLRTVCVSVRTGHRWCVRSPRRAQ